MPAVCHADNVLCRRAGIDRRYSSERINRLAPGVLLRKSIPGPNQAATSNALLVGSWRLGRLQSAWGAPPGRPLPDHPVSHILYLISCILYLLYLVSCISYLVSCILYLVSCISYLVSRILYLVSCILYLVSCILYLASYLASCILYLVSCISHLVSCICTSPGMVIFTTCLEILQKVRLPIRD